MRPSFQPLVADSKAAPRLAFAGSRIPKCFACCCSVGENLTEMATPTAASSGDSTYKWNKEQTEKFIRLRVENDNLFTGAKHSAAVGWRIILEKMGLLGRVEPQQAKKKWDNLKKKYKDCKYPGTGEGVSGKPTAATWPWFALMDEVLGQRPSIAPPVLIASLPEDTPGPAAAVGQQEEEEDEEEEEEPVPGPRRKRSRDDELLELLREDMRQQREAEERRERESRERMERLFSLLERLVDRS
ncbi:uncharacterized protein LOC115356742 [Myripristis murdjan]|uniref:uncharacterized protein LOC115356742 n=1 Tax=Myripristis murdjan TaxID=586833 RepID=UPI001176328B|nr:uncharacterized protein LOC115356742 [Myripristis murdjan]